MAIVNPHTPPNDAERDDSSSRYSLPLYDPHGLGSPSDAETSNTHAWQLRPQQRDESPSPLNTGQASTSSLIDQSSRIARRGRRRRSSEYVHSNVDTGQDGEDDLERIAVEPLLWWQRSKQGTDSPSSGSKVNHTTLPALQTQRNSHPSSSPSPSVRSPAAAFLSSMNESLGSPSSQIGKEGERGYSISPIRNGIQDHRLSMPLLSSIQGPEGSALGFTSAAAQMFDAAKASENHGSSLVSRPDEEGATLGPEGRYLLGKVIGFGGFSTIREAWDLGSEAERAESNDKRDLHRIAVKIVYSNEEENLDDGARENEELRIWETIPAHPNLLPLLHHERVVVDHDISGGKKKQAISFLVMPYCEGSLLAFVKTEGSLPENATASPDLSSLSRSGSVRASKTPLAQYEAALRQQSVYPRTGSGFIPRSAGTRVTSVPLSNMLGQLGHSPLSNTGSVGSSSLLRRASSRISRAPQVTNGVPFQAARKVMQQITKALICLHTRASIAHGDLKLENVLGQRSISRSHRPKRGREYEGSSGEDSDNDDIFASMQDEAGLTSLESICWRIADFGLARRVSSKGSAREPYETQDIADMQEKASKARKGIMTVGGAGGSLAYTAPEVFLPTAYSSTGLEGRDIDAPSPFASDMWAVGCILYALCSGKLPFSDSFEPRLQMKIAKGTWDMPHRLRRFNERKNKAPAASQSIDNSRRERSLSGYKASESMSRTNSLSASFAPYKPPHSTAPNVGSSTVMDMSASMPALQDRHFFQNRVPASTSDQSIIEHVPVEDSFIMEEQEESDKDSDDDEQVNRGVDGSSRDRVSIRLILRKLLEPDPSKRWTIEQLASQHWISGPSSIAFSGIEEPHSRISGNADDYPGMQGSLLGHSLSKRPSLAQPSISEHTSQEESLTKGNNLQGDGLDCDGSEEEDDIGRGRSIRRDAAAREKGAAKPIDIDRSTSRSHSRPRAHRVDSSPWEQIESSFEKALQMAGPWEQMPSRRVLQRSTSADPHGVNRGRSTASSKDRRSVSRPPHLGDVKAKEHSPAPAIATPTKESDETASRSSTSRSRSRARDSLLEIASKGDANDSNDDRLWWQRGRKK